MKYLKYFSIFESISDFNRIGDWIISYNDVDHDLDSRMINRTDLNETTFKLLLDKIVEVSESDSLNETWVFVSLKYKTKIIINIDSYIKDIRIITFLGKNEFLKETQKVKYI